MLQLAEKKHTMLEIRNFPKNGWHFENSNMIYQRENIIIWFYQSSGAAIPVVAIAKAT